MAPKTNPEGVITAIPELFNLNRIEAATRALKLKAIMQQDDHPACIQSLQTLDYIFDEPVCPGPNLKYKIKQSQDETWVGEVLPDLKIAKLVLSPPGARHQAAPYAFRKNGQLYPEYRDAVRKHLDEIGATEKDKHSASPHGLDMEEWSAEKIQQIRQERIEQLAASNWEIVLTVQGKYEPVFQCIKCGEKVARTEKKSHVEEKGHKTKNISMLFEQVGSKDGNQPLVED